MVQFVISIIFALGVLFLWGVMIVYTWNSMKAWKKEKSHPAEDVRAHVDRCFEEEAYVFQFGEKVIATHNVEFKCDDGRKFLFSLTPGQYQSLREGDYGTLRIRDGIFVSFDSLTQTGHAIYAKGTSAEEVYAKLVKGR